MFSGELSYLIMSSSILSFLRYTGFFEFSNLVWGSFKDGHVIATLSLANYIQNDRVFERTGQEEVTKNVLVRRMWGIKYRERLDSGVTE